MKKNSTVGVNSAKLSVEVIDKLLADFEFDQYLQFERFSVVTLVD